MNLGISLREYAQAHGDAAALGKSAAVFERLLGDGAEHLDTDLRARALSAYGGTLLAEARASSNPNLMDLAVDRLRNAVTGVLETRSRHRPRRGAARTVFSGRS